MDFESRDITTATSGSDVVHMLQDAEIKDTMTSPTPSIVTFRCSAPIFISLSAD